MSAPEFRRLVERIRELATQAEGDLYVIPLGRFEEELPEGLTHDEQVRRTMPVSNRQGGQPRIDIGPIRRRGRTHPPTGSKQIRKFEIELRVVRTLPLDAIKKDAERYDELALAVEDGEVLDRVLEQPANLERTAAGELTGCRSLVNTGSDPVVRSGPRGAGAPQRIETIHKYRGWCVLDVPVP